MSNEPGGVGAALSRSPAVAWTALAFGVAVAAGDMLLVSAHLTVKTRTWTVGAASLAGVVLVLGALARWDWRSLGLRVVPIQGWWYWAKLTVIAAAGFGVLLLAIYGGARLLGIDTGPAPYMTPDQLGWFLRQGVVEAPLFEETIYRLALCTGAVAVLRKWPTIAVSGLAFGVLHVLYGNPGPDNILAGYVLAWAYLKSGTIWLPVVYHALGNLTVYLVGVSFYYWG